MSLRKQSSKKCFCIYLIADNNNTSKVAIPVHTRQPPSNYDFNIKMNPFRRLINQNVIRRSNNDDDDEPQPQIREKRTCRTIFRRAVTRVVISRGLGSIPIKINEVPSESFSNTKASVNNFNRSNS